MTPYVGNAPYCYANAAAMLLAAAGEPTEPSTIESLTSVGLGARWWLSDRTIYFSLVPPDIGLGRAFERLGFAVAEESGADNGTAPFKTLRALLAGGPALLGPLDMQHLTYLPNHGELAGCDHFVVLTELGREEARLYDPNGYVGVALPLVDLERAWRADGIDYARAPFRYWHRPRRQARPSVKTLHKAVLAGCREAYDSGRADDPRCLTGRAAFEAAAEAVRAPDADGLRALLKVFGLPLGARRAQDLAQVLAPHDPVLGAVKARQSRAFIDGYRAVADGDLEASAEFLIEIGKLDEAFRGMLARTL